ncbi:hypothetical protein J3R83DRAFT_5708 [Lanmaoa asiatica]|nr:hypothetical protein J3R83DRAFT_5708 [Lanmaoa asiatica]
MAGNGLQPEEGALHFKRLPGFKLHRDARSSSTSSGQHLKIRSDLSGTLSITKKAYKAPKKQKIDSASSKSESASVIPIPNFQDIPLCIDDLPASVDLSILVDQNSPRQPAASDTPLLTWMEEDRDDFLRELIHLEGRNGVTACSSCKTGPATYHCDDCLGIDLYCKGCIVSRHTSQPVHLIKEWSGDYWIQRSLKELGLVIQLGHCAGEACYLPKIPYSDDFTILDTNGIHSVALRFCGCEIADTPVQQLLRCRLFPVSTQQPRTAATFSLLEEFHLLSLESKLSTYQYYNSLARRIDNTGLFPAKVCIRYIQLDDNYHAIQDRYEQFLRIIREWRHLKMLKRSGRGHDPAGVQHTQEGECCVLCPACPQPGKNLPDNWDKVSKDKQWLYALFVAIDANFRLKRRAVSKDDVDPSLSQGWGYFVEELSYKLYLRDHANFRQEKSMCSSHSAVNAAESKSTRGLAATGVGSVCCARHEMKLPSSVGDLQKGERYINMDYLFFSAIKDTSVRVLNISYDIACQWMTHLWERMATLPHSMQFPYKDRKINALVPKFHLPAHVAKCQWQYSFNYISGMGRTDGEAPERGWAALNAVASSTKEMGPGHRRDTLDDLIGDSNWKKLTSLGEAILHKIIEAVPERNDHQGDLRELEHSLEERYGDQLSKWKVDIEAWEMDMSKPNPFEIKASTITQASVRLQLAREEAGLMDTAPVHTEISQSVLIGTGLDLEEQQQRLRSDTEKLGSHATDQQKAKLLQRSNALMRRIEAWTDVQMLYIPRVVSLRAKTSLGSGAVQSPEHFHLWLPSALQRQIPCDRELEEIEWKLRVGQAHDALEELRQGLRSLSYMLRFKDRFLRGQGATTQARNCLALVGARIDLCAAKYRAAYGALLALSPLLGKVGWKSTFRPLEKEDIRCMTDGTDDRASEGRRRLSWIWIACGSDNGEGGEDQSLQDAIRIEWCKARARAHRWAEEVELLVEEQRRILQFLHWQSTWWLDRRALIKTDDSALNEGMRAYALRQAALRQDLAKHFEHIWRNTQRYIEIGGGINLDNPPETTSLN